MVLITACLLFFFVGFFLRGRGGHEILVEVERADPAVTAQEQSRTVVETAVPAVEEDGRLDLNTATQEELESLPGVGPVLAERILRYREAHGFASVSELLNVEGVGEKIYQKIVDDVKVG